jgi:molybdate transport system permease protein
VAVGAERDIRSHTRRYPEDTVIHHDSRSPFRISLTAITLIGVALLTLPTAALLWRALDAGTALDDPATRDILRDALVLSLTTSAVAMAAIVVIGTPIAYTLARSTSRVARVIDALVDLPILLPPAVAGIALLTAFGRAGILGDALDTAGIRIGFSTAAVVIAQIFVGAPFYIRSARAGFMKVEQRLEDVAADLGAPPWRVFRKIILPLARNSLLAGAVLAWARALGEFGATIMFAGNRQGVTQTMPLAIYERFGAGDLPTAITFSALLLAVSVILLVLVRLLGEDR